MNFIVVGIFEVVKGLLMEVVRLFIKYMLHGRVTVLQEVVIPLFVRFHVQNRLVSAFMGLKFRNPIKSLLVAHLLMRLKQRLVHVFRVMVPFFVVVVLNWNPMG